MSPDSRSQTAERLRHLMETEGESVGENTRGFNAGRYESVADLENYEALREQARTIKEDAIEQLPQLVDQLRESVTENGGTVYVAEDAADANEYITSVAADADRLVKSKSMTTEELEVNDALHSAGIDVVETDLAEWVLQLADEEPSHIVAPSIHKSRESIAELFNARFDPDESLESPEELTAFAREKLGDLIRDADVGMTGANFITADSGTIALVTSEGNARKTAVVPDTHVAVAGVEKIVPTVEDLQPFVELIGRSATGQDITSYVSLLTPPVVSPTLSSSNPDAPLAGEADREFHLVLIDNGRLSMRKDDQLRETLYCIRCSACSNVCANFQSVGGHGFGGETYSGGIATGWEAGIEGLDTAAEFNDLCTGCSRCVDACPVKIDIPWINTVVRDRINQGKDSELDWLVDGLTPDEESGGLSLQKRFFGNFESIAKVASATAPLSNWVAERSLTRTLTERLVGLDHRRDLPTFRRQTLRKWFTARGGGQISPADASREAVLYPDLYTNYVQVERGKAAVTALEALGVHVRIPDVRSSGRAPLSQGMITTAGTRANDVYGALAEHLDAGRDVVVIEPSDLAMFEREYERLLPSASYRQLADASYEILEYIYGLLESGSDKQALTHAGDDDRVAYHSHCQQRTLGLEDYTVAVLERLGYDIITSDVECCGMAGSFGYKREYYEVSMDVGEQLRTQFETEDARDRTVVASGTSCLEQLDSVLRRPIRHPVELIAP